MMMWQGVFKHLKQRGLSDRDLERQLDCQPTTQSHVQTMSVNWLPLLITLTDIFQDVLAAACNYEILSNPLIEQLWERLRRNGLAVIGVNSIYACLDVK